MFFGNCRWRVYEIWKTITNLNKIIESTNIVLQISHKFANPRIVAKSKKLFCRSEKIFCHVLLAPAVCHHQRFSRHFAASKMAEFCVSCGSKVNPGDKFCFKCGTKVAEISHLRRSTCFVLFYQVIIAILGVQSGRA